MCSIESITIINKVDKYYVENLKKIMSEGSWDENTKLLPYGSNIGTPSIKI
jgi:hypothetical protein